MIYPATLNVSDNRLVLDVFGVWAELGKKINPRNLKLSCVWQCQSLTLYNVCSVHRGMFSTSGDVQYIGGIP